LAAHPNDALKLVTVPGALAGLRAAWNELAETAESPNVFMTFDWFDAWNRRLAADDDGRRRQLHLVVLKARGAVVGIAPLIQRTASRFGMSVRKVEFLESPADYNDLVVGRDQAGQCEAVLHSLRRAEDDWDIVDLRNLRDTGGVLSALTRALSHTNFAYRIVREARCPYLPIDADWSGMVSRLSRSTRRTIRNQQHRLDRMRSEGLCVRIIECPGEEPGLLDTLIALEREKRVRGTRVPPFIARYPDVFQSLFDTLGPRGWIYVALMELGDRPLAWQLGFRCGDKLWDFSTAYDASFARLSPGTMLMPALLDYAYSHGYTEYDFLRGEEPYKLTWSTGTHDTFRVLIWSPRWTRRARAFVYLDAKEMVYRLIGSRASNVS
jgi:CelD/BcsL family acetyltransferase involved in cellulose biosynthesis